jgi:thioredoxin reductase (NADPH)
MDQFPVVIIGAGPAGLAAAMQLTRQGQEVLVLERTRVGGLLWNANLLENYPGFPEGISGPALVELFQQQADRLRVKVEIEEAVSTSYQGGRFRIITNQREISARYLVAASGTAPRKLADPVLGAELAERVFWEVHPLLGCRDRTIAIIGAGDAAFDYALNLANHNRVIILNRERRIKALGLLVERAGKHPNISYFEDAPVEVVSLTEQGALQLRTGSPPQRLDFQADYLIAALGREPDTSFADPSIIKNKTRLLKKQRLFMIGDLVNGSHRQTAIAVGDGIRAAMIIGDLLQRDIL